ncbi:hypothetical protein MNBD_GAMMA22-991 [hydrothermal vent metagenome]|uniref:YqcC-like domain-containing protein n=1 Tax=hydrothermal vent metagenome TaxID=652676 RepID=A0A3B1B3Z0_9ZZZZ
MKKIKIIQKKPNKYQVVLQKISSIESEMKRINYWSHTPPDLLADVKSGKIKSYLDAPSFELWLQCIFIPNVIDRAQEQDFPDVSHVGFMALRYYNNESIIEDAQPLLKMLLEFDRIIEEKLF